MRKLSVLYPLSYGYDNIATLEEEDNIGNNIVSLIDMVGGSGSVVGECLWDGRIGTGMDLYRHQKMESVDIQEMRYLLQKSINFVWDTIDVGELQVTDIQYGKDINFDYETKIDDNYKRESISYEWNYRSTS